MPMLIPVAPVARAFAACAAFIVLVALALAGCESTSSPPDPDASGTSTPTRDGAVCACATPDCLPNCSALPACTIQCVGGVKVVWVDPCGNTQYVQSCMNGCTDASTAGCQ